MPLKVVKYGDPVLRQKGTRIEKVTADVRKLVEEMIETMYAAKGVGLAAQQIGRALQLAVIDVTGAKDRPSMLELNGKPAEPAELMPLVLINPEIKPASAPVPGPEGCLSFPEIFADITRPESIDVETTTLDGKPLRFRCGGLLARAIQHEADHLNGVLFIDRMTREDKSGYKSQLDEIQAETKAALKKKR
jgi:peptide deformylase